MPFSPLRLSLAAAGLAALVTAVVACSYSWEVILDIEIAADVVLPTDARLVIVQGPDAADVAGRAPADAPWGVAATDTVTLAADQRTHRFEGSTCCAPTETNFAWAFVDLDNDGTYDAGEPYGADPGNPVEVSADYTVKLVVQNP